MADRCVRALISGTVQGVGFRYATQHQARALGARGYVRNLPDGRVELVLEGLPNHIDEGLGRVHVALAGHIDDEAAEAGQATGEFRDFRIRA